MTRIAGATTTRGSHFGVIASSPPYALDAPAFPFRALAALAGRTTLGADREVALGCFMAARLASGCLEPALPQAGRQARAQGARTWYAGLTLPAATRVPFARLADASGGTDPAAVAEALRQVIACTADFLDAAARLELERLAGSLADAS